MNRRYGLAGDVHARVAARLAHDGLTPLLDAGCGEGALVRLLEGGPITCVGIDRAAALLAHAPRSVVRGDITRLPFADGAFAAVASLYVLYHLAAPVATLRELARVLRPGGLFACCTTSRGDSPELQTVLGLPPERPTPFDAEDAPALVGAVFHEVTVEAWDGAFTVLPDREAVRLYLIGRQTPADVAEHVAERAPTPLSITKRGALIWARNPG